MGFVWKNKGNYSYLTTRVKAKKSQFITKDVYPKLISMELVEVSRFMGETSYKVEMAELASKYHGVNLVEMATYMNLARIYKQILNMSKGELHDMIGAYLRYWDVWNLKTILRGRTYGASLEEINEDLVVAGELSSEYLTELASLETVEDIIERIEEDGEFQLPETCKEELSTCGTVGAIEDVLDRKYYRDLLKSVRPSNRPKRMFRSFIEREIDVINLGTLFKLKMESVSGEDICKYFIEGGKELDVSSLTKLAQSEDFDHMVRELSTVTFFSDIKGGLEVAKDTGSLVTVMAQLKRVHIREANKFSRLHPLSVLPIVDYMIRKKTEVDNIRIIARGKESGLDPGTIKSLLVI